MVGGSIAVDIDIQPAKAWSQISVTLSGTEIALSDVQPEKALLPMVKKRFPKRLKKHAVGNEKT